MGWQHILWPKVDTPENAASAAKNGGVAFGFIALGYAIWLIRLAVWYRQELLRETQLLRETHPVINHNSHQLIIPFEPVLLRPTVHTLVIVLIAVLLAWRTYKRSSLLLCTIALVWVLLKFVDAAASYTVRSDVLGVGIYCASILGTVAALGGVRGAWGARRFRQSPPEVVV